MAESWPTARGKWVVEEGLVSVTCGQEARAAAVAIVCPINLPHITFPRKETSQDPGTAVPREGGLSV